MSAARGAAYRAAARRTTGNSSARPAGRRGRRTSLVESAYEEIRRRILDNEYPPAHQVLEQDLAADLGMSRTPLREALVRLQNENFIQLIPRHGMRVVPLSLEDLRDTYEVLTALEVAAIERLARTGQGREALGALEQALDAMDAALKARDRDAWVKADERFHRTLLDLCGNRRLAAVAYTLWDHGHRARMTTVRLRPTLGSSNKEHRAVFEAIKRGRWSDARRLHVQHRARTSQEILTLLEQTRLGRF